MAKPRNQREQGPTSANPQAYNTPFFEDVSRYSPGDNRYDTLDDAGVRPDVFNTLSQDDQWAILMGRPFSPNSAPGDFGPWMLEDAGAGPFTSFLNMLGLFGGGTEGPVGMNPLNRPSPKANTNRLNRPSEKEDVLDRPAKKTDNRGPERKRGK